MTRDELKYILQDLRNFKLFPKRYKTTTGKSAGYWSHVHRAYGNFKKRVGNSGWHWYVGTYKDGRKELAYLRVLQNGIFSGLASAIYRGILIPHRISFAQFDAMKNIRVAF